MILLNDICSSIRSVIENKLHITEIILNGAFTGVRLDDGSMGVAMNVRSGTASDAQTRQYLLSLIGNESFSAYEDLIKKAALCAAGSAERFLINSVIVGLFNALSLPLMNEQRLLDKGYNVQAGTKDGLEKFMQPGETITIVGYGGMVRALSKIAKQTFVTELEPELFTSYRLNSAGIEKGPTSTTVIKSSNQDDCFSQSDRIFMTGSTLVTDTMDEILHSCRGKHIVVYGATTAFLPEPLFSSGIESIHTMTVTNPELMIELLLNCGGAVERFFPMASESLHISKF